MRLTKKIKYTGGGAVVEISLGAGAGCLGWPRSRAARAYRSAFSSRSSGSCGAGGILKSRRGAHGGYCLAIPAAEVTVLDFVKIPDGEVRPARHPEGGGHYTDKAPPRSTLEIWKEVPIALEGASNRYSIVRLAETERRSAGAQERGSAGAAKGAKAPIGR